MFTLLTGGSGLLGQELQKHMEFYAPPRNVLDITREIYCGFKPDLIVHAAAYTKVEQAEIDRLECFEVNVKGTMNLLEACKDIPFVYISSEYAYNPLNFYGLTKSLAEQLVSTHPSHLIIRTLFKPTPWKYEKAFKNAFTQGDYVDIIAPLIAQEIRSWNFKSKTIYIGTGRKTIFELAKRTRPDVIGNLVEDIKNVRIPKDYA